MYWCWDQFNKTSLDNKMLGPIQQDFTWQQDVGTNSTRLHLTRRYWNWDQFNQTSFLSVGVDNCMAHNAWLLILSLTNMQINYIRILKKGLKHLNIFRRKIGFSLHRTMLRKANAFSVSLECCNSDWWEQETESNNPSFRFLIIPNIALIYIKNTHLISFKMCFVTNDFFVVCSFIWVRYDN